MSKIDLTTVDSVYPDKTSPAGSAYYHSRRAIISRGQRALKFLYERPEKIVFIVSHSGFMRVGVSGRWFFNADYRIFDLERQEDGEIKPVHDDSMPQGALGLSSEVMVALGDQLPEEDPAFDPDAKA